MNVNPSLMTPNLKIYSQDYDSIKDETCNNLLVFANGSTTPCIIDISTYLAEDALEIFCNLCATDGANTYVVLGEYMMTGDYTYSVYSLGADNASLSKTFDLDFDEEIIYDLTCKVKNGDLYFKYDYASGDNVSNRIKVLSASGNELAVVDSDFRLITWAPGEGDDIYLVTEDDVISTTTNSNPLVLTKVDYESGNSEILNTDPSFDKYKYGVVFDDPVIYLQNYDYTITAYDILKNEETLFFDLNFCDANMNDLGNSSLYYCDGNRMVFLKDFNYASEELLWDVVIDVTRADSNPNAGKKMIFAAPSERLNYIDAEGIRRFNAEHSDYFCYVTMKYSKSLFDYSTFSADTYEYDMYKTELIMLSTLQQDIVSGNGPDILLNFGEYSTLNSASYLINLLPVLDGDNGLDRSEYFDNFFDAYIVYDELYQIPICAAVGGIYTDRVTNSSQIGFTYDEYNQFVKEECSGFDPISYWNGRSEAFDLLQKYGYSDFHNLNGSLNINTDKYKKLCEYLYRFPETQMEEGTGVATCENFGNIPGELISMLISKDKQLYGLPSLEEKGPAAYIPESVAVTGCTISEDVAWELVESLLSYDVQRLHKEHNPINKKAFVEYGINSVSVSNSMIEMFNGFENYYSEEIIEVYEGYLEQATVPMLSDTITLSIMMEELQPYFAGQKSIEDVIPIMESRANTMLEERK